MSRDLGAVTTFDDVLVGGQGQDDDAAAHSTTPTTPLVLPTHSDAVQVYAMEMDISEPVGVLKARAGEALHLKMDSFTVWVLSEHRLSDTETLQEQCGTESGLVQVQFMVKGGEADGRIDIIDVLKPNEGDTVEGSNKGKSDADASSSTAITATTAPVPSMATTATTTKAKPKTTRWIVCPTFKELQRVLKIPQDPLEWTCGHVRQWLSWAICQFGLTGIDTGRWNMTGRQLLALSLTDFRTLAPDDPGDIFYMHFELLRRTSVVAVVCDPHSLVPRPARPKLMCRPCSPTPSITAATTITPSVSKSMGGRDAAMRSVGFGGSGGGGGGQQIQLWQFLLELLTDPKVSNIISWYGEDGQFRLHQPEVVASLWGQRKSKPNMNYEKLSRALRYYYDGEMIAKVSGKRFVYRFVLDLRSVLGYSADQLKHMVEQCHEKDV